MFHSLKAKIILFTALPLILQTVLIFRLADLQAKAEQAVSYSIRYSQISEALNEFNERSYRLLDLFFGTKIDRSSAPTVVALFNDQLKLLNAPLEKLEKVAGDDPEISDILETCRQLRSDIFKNLRALGRALLSPSDYEGSRIELNKNFQRIAKRSAQTVATLQVKVSHLSRLKDMQRMQLEGEQHSLITAVGVLAAITAIAATIGLSNDTSTRLRKVSENVRRFGSGLEPAAPLLGNDDISTLDQTFYRMAVALRQSERKETAFVENSQDGIMFMDQDFNLTYGNAALHTLLQIDQLPDVKFFDFVDPPSRQLVQNYLRSLHSGTSDSAIPLQLVVKGGIKHVILSSVFETDTRMFLCSLHDVSDQVNISQLRDQLISMFTHDLKNPLQSIKLSIEDLHGKPELTDHRLQIERLQLSAQRMTSLIEDLLDKYKAESGMMTFAKESVSVAALLKSASDAMSVMAAALDVTIKIDEQEPDLNLCADRDATLRIVLNLLANGIKHSPAGKTIHVAAVALDNEIEISVRDEGSGIPEEEQGRIFERFYQASTARTARLSGLGSGLGLAICKLFAEGQGGRVFLKSSPEEGSTFTLVLPRI